LFLNGPEHRVFAALPAHADVAVDEILGAVLVGPALGHLGFAEVFGARHAATSSGCRGR